MQAYLNPTRRDNGFGFILYSIWAGILILPGLIWLQNSRLIDDYFYGVELSQSLYVLSKLFALYAIIILWLQLVSTLNQNTRFQWMFPLSVNRHHRLLGLSAFVLTTLHIFFFVTAVSLRKQTLTINLLWPDFQDYYHTGISLGSISFWMMFIAVSAIGFAYYWLKQRVLLLVTLHRITIIAVILGFVHSLMIGTETRQGFYLYYYSFLLATMAISFLLRFKGKTAK